ncbi:UDP-glycosyltransferase 76B1-like [Mangifera indica]|uniref:UDP-glycosyltransferase 76B1-like n=1 Tax=Mangifera indica TaxID=29780 RepID=UPI001CFC1143|nr:UDP-glycosyltransferase 76B1-like [Mangifera indica]
MENQGEFHLQQRKGRRVILFPLPLQGHINPMLQLASILYNKGFSISIIHTNFNSLNSSNYPHFSFHSIPDGLSQSEASFADMVALLSLLNVKCVAPFQDCLGKLLSNSVDGEKIACLITDAVWYFTQTVAENLKVPRLVLRTNSVSSFLVFAAFPLLREKGYMPAQDCEPEAPVPELPPLRVKDIPVFETRIPETLHQVQLGLINQTRVSSGCIWNSFQDLEQVSLATLQKEFPVPMFPIGPFHKYFPASSSSLLSQDRSAISWLDKQQPKSVIYVSFGSVAAINDTEFLETAWGLANSMVPFLWVVRPGLVRGAEWTEPLPKGFLEMLDGRGHIVKWAPQQEILAHPAIGGFWTHNGWNSTLESICEGVPMICQPCFGDQMVNARYVSHVWKIGLHLERKLEREEIEKTIKRVMLEEEGQEMRERIMYLKEKADICLKQGGSSYQSLENLINYILSF